MRDPSLRPLQVKHLHNNATKYPRSIEVSPARRQISWLTTIISLARTDQSFFIKMLQKYALIKENEVRYTEEMLTDTNGFLKALVGDRN